MATLDQLPAEQRAIVELVVQRGRSYDALAEVLQVPSQRVRELARDALTELSPRTAKRVEPEDRGKIADYLLRQASGDDAATTRDLLRDSETGRAWALSLLDSLDPLYPDGVQPEIPDPGEDESAAAAAVMEPEAEEEAAAEPETEAVAEPEDEAVAEPEAEEQAEAEQPKRGAATVEDRVRERARKPKAEKEPKAEKKPKKDKPKKEERREPAKEKRPAGTLSPAARSALLRRRRLGLAGGLVVVVAVVLGVLAAAGAFSGDDSTDTGGASTTGSSTTPANQQPLQVLGQIELNAVGKTKAQGVAYIVQQSGKRFLVVQAKVPPLPQDQKVAAYEVWLYNSNDDARSLGAQYTDAQGVLQGRANLPDDFAKYKSIDISRELFSDKDAGHGNNSVLRGAFSSLKAVPEQQQQQGQGQGGGGTGTTPSP